MYVNLQEEYFNHFLPYTPVSKKTRNLVSLQDKYPLSI